MLTDTLRAALSPLNLGLGETHGTPVGLLVTIALIALNPVTVPAPYKVVVAVIFTVGVSFQIGAIILIVSIGLFPKVYAIPLMVIAVGLA